MAYFKAGSCWPRAVDANWCMAHGSGLWKFLSYFCDFLVQCLWLTLMFLKCFTYKNGFIRIHRSCLMAGSCWPRAVDADWCVVNLVTPRFNEMIRILDQQVEYLVNGRCICNGQTAQFKTIVNFLAARFLEIWFSGPALLACWGTQTYHTSTCSADWVARNVLSHRKIILTLENVFILDKKSGPSALLFQMLRSQIWME
jgi:hypothetical protein